MGLLRQLHWLPNYISIDEGIPAVPGSNWLYDIVCLHLMQFLPSTSSNHRLFETKDDGLIRSRGDHNFSLFHSAMSSRREHTSHSFRVYAHSSSPHHGDGIKIDSCGVWLTTTLWSKKQEFDLLFGNVWQPHGFELFESQHNVEPAKKSSHLIEAKLSLMVPKHFLWILPGLTTAYPVVSTLSSLNSACSYIKASAMGLSCANERAQQTKTDQ